MKAMLEIPKKYVGRRSMRELNLANIKLWYDALKSGEYVQGKGTMRWLTVTGERRYQYCGMGVAWDLFYRRTGRRWPDSFNALAPGAELATYAAFQDFLGIDGGMDVWLLNGTVSVIELNDKVGLTLSQIADLIWYEFLAGKDIPDPGSVSEKKSEDEEELDPPFGAPDGPVQTDWLPASFATMTFSKMPEEWLELFADMLLPSTAKELVAA